MVVGAGQSFQFLRQIVSFFGNNRALSKFRYRILHKLASITKLLKNHSIKDNFNLTKLVTLMETSSIFYAGHCHLCCMN